MDSHLAKEWGILQSQFDSYEKYSLIIKLLSILLLASIYLFKQFDHISVLLLMTLWLQDAIWKTFQSRIDIRLLQVETLLANNDGEPEMTNKNIQAYQFNRLFLENGYSNIDKIKEYFKQAIKPTVAFPYVFLILIVVCEIIFS